jgi:hypothetical protein
MQRLMNLLLLSLVLFVGCKLPCNKGFISPAFVGFSPADIDTFILRAYRPNDNYLHLIDTIIVQHAGTTIYTTSNDTTFVDINTNINQQIVPDFDWQIYIPAKNRTVLISNIVSEHIEGGHLCNNPINSFLQDGQLIIPNYVKTNEFYTSGYMAYIK